MLSSKSLGYTQEADSGATNSEPNNNNHGTMPMNAANICCSKMKYRTVVIIVIFLSIMHLMMGIVSISLGTISSIQGIVWMAHRVSPIWSGVFFVVTGLAGVLCLKYQTPYITLCYAASTLVSLVSTIVCLQLSRLGIVNHTTDGQVYRKEHLDRLLLATLVITGTESLVCLAGCFMSCRLNSLVKQKILREAEGPFSVEVFGDKDVHIIPRKGGSNNKQLIHGNAAVLSGVYSSDNTKIMLNQSMLGISNQNVAATESGSQQIGDIV